MPPEVFISYASRDYDQAKSICNALEQAGTACWIAPRDIAPGTVWGSAIVQAIDNAKLMVVVISSHTLNSKHVAREVERADSKDKILVPFFVEQCLLQGPLAYYLEPLQAILANTPDLNLDRLIPGVQTALQGGGQAGARSDRQGHQIRDEDLVALGRAICRNVFEELTATISPEDSETITEIVHGKEVKFIDLACNRRARQAQAHWESRHKTSVLLTGEDIAETLPPAVRPAVLCCLDSLDGTQHWLRSKNLYCTALSIFARDERNDSPYRLRVSMIQEPDGRLVLAREDVPGAFIDGVETQLSGASNPVTEIAHAHVCTVCRRPDHFRVMVPFLAQGSPFSGLYMFGGNPILADVSLGKYDAVFQPDASALMDSQPIWDWLPGGHIAYRSGCSILGLDGNDLNVVLAAEDAVNRGSKDYPYVAATNRPLAEAIVRWLNSSNSTFGNGSR